MSSLGNIGRVWVKSISSGVKAVNRNPVKESLPSCFLLIVDHFGSGEGLATSVAQEEVLDLERIVSIIF